MVVDVEAQQRDADGTEGAEGAEPRPVADGRGRRPRRFRRVVLAVVLLLVVVLAWAGWVAWRGMTAAEALQGARPVLGEVEAAVRDGDVDAALARLPELQERADTAVGAVSDPLWRAAEHLPVVGDDLAAVSAVARAYAVVADDVVPPLAEVAGSVQAGALVPHEEGVDLAPLIAAAPRVTDAAAAAEDAVGLVSGVDTTALVPVVADRVTEARALLADGAATLDGLGQVLAVLPGALGADGPRDYLVLMLNSAELRTAGGIAGSATVLTVDDGSMALADNRAAPDYGKHAAPVLPLSDEELAVHGDRLARYFQNTTGTPEFARTGALAAEMWRLDTGQEVDGVLALDPVALSYLLGAVGPVEDADGVLLTQGDVAETLLVDAYRRYPDPRDADAYFSDVTARVFDALLGSSSDPVALLDALARAADERRLLVWSRDGQVQDLLGASRAGGAFLSGGADAATGIFLDDVTGAKLGTFLEVAGTVRPATCAGWAERAGSDDVAVVRLELRSTVPEDHTGLPDYVSGAGFADVPGLLRTNLSVYAPVGGDVLEVRRDGTTVAGPVLTESGREVMLLTSQLPPGAVEVYEVAVRGAGGAPAELWTTPTVGSPGVVVSSC